MENYQKFRIIDAIFVVGSILTFIADQATDVILGVTFYLDGLPHYSILVLLLVVIPNAVVQIFSARWNALDEYSSKTVACIHTLLLGTLHRLFDSFMESAPQLVFQLYVLIEVSDWSTFNVTWTCVSAVSSMVSLGWGVAAYSQALRMVREDKGKLSWMGMVLQTVWRFSMLSARIVALVLISLTLHRWVFIVIGAHWFVMTCWVVYQNTDFCTNKWEERVYNAVVGVIYCFCFFNLKEGRSRYRMASFYLIIFIENAGFVAAYYWMSHRRPEVPVTWFSFGAMIIVLGGTMIGLCSMILYYRFFHPAGPIPLCINEKDVEHDVSDRQVEQRSPDFTIKSASYVDEKEAHSYASENKSNKSDGEEKTKKKYSTLKHSRSFKYSTKDYSSNTLSRDKYPSPIVISALDLVNTSNTSSNPGVQSGPSSPHSIAEGGKERIDSAYGTDSNRTASRNTEISHSCPGAEKSPVGSFNTAANSQLNTSAVHDRSGTSSHERSSSSSAFNNETYMSIENASPEEPQGADQSYISIFPATNDGPMTPDHNPNNTYQSVHPMSDGSGRSGDQASGGVNTSQGSRCTVIDTTHHSTPRRPSQDLLKRSPIVRDITAGFTPIERAPPPFMSREELIKVTIEKEDKCEVGKEKLHAPLTIIIPNISNQASVSKSSATQTESPDQWSEKTISLDILNPHLSGDSKDVSAFSSHDYENLALVNINRGPMGSNHWRTYSDMATSRHDDSTKYERNNKLNFTSSSEYSTYSNLAHCDIYPLTRAMRDQLYRSLTPVSTAATFATSSNQDNGSSADSNHTYEPIENAQAMFENIDNDSTDGLHHATPFTLIHHDGRRVTANKIVSLDNLRDTLMAHERVPYDDPESRGDLYILAPMRLLTPVIEETDSDITRSKLYQSLASTHSQAYSDVDHSIMSIISEVLNFRAESRLQGSLYSNPPQDPSRGARARLDTIEEDDACSLLHTIEEIRNNSLCNLYYTSSTSDLNRSGMPPPAPPIQVPAVLPMTAPALVPRVPPRGTSGYKSLTKENQTSRNNLRGSISGSSLPPATATATTSYTQVMPHTQSNPEIVHNSIEDEVDLNESLKSVNSNTLVPTPPTVKKVKAPLNSKGGVRKNILNLVGSTNDILNTPKRVKIGNTALEKLSLTPKESTGLSESMVSEHNEFKSLVPHLTSQGAKFLSKLKAGADIELDQSTVSSNVANSNINDFSTFTDTPSPKPFVRQLDTNKNIIRRKFSLIKRKQIETVEEVRDDNSDYKYGFMPENPDAKYGFGVFNAATESYNVVETAKLSGTVSGSNLRPAAPPSTIVPAHAYSLSALNRGDTDFRIHPDQQYANFQRKNWVSNSLQRRPSRGIGDRADTTRRSMSILDDYEEKENLHPPPRKIPRDGGKDDCPPPPPPLMAKRRAPFAAVNPPSTSPFKILNATNRNTSGQATVCSLSKSSLSNDSRLFR